MFNDNMGILEGIRQSADHLHKQYAGKLDVNHDLDRTLVSFQANKNKNGHRWCKYKEGFSSDLVRYLLRKIDLTSGCILDPFAGSGAALFTASDLEIDSVGIELLPSSAEIIEVRRLIRSADANEIADHIRQFRESQIWSKPGEKLSFPHIRITKGSFPLETEIELGRYLFEIRHIQDNCLKRILFFAASCVLEDISYTRKDGQYLRWDYRSGRRVGKKPFNKGTIKPFTLAICEKLDQIIGDIKGDQLELPEIIETRQNGNIELFVGSCFDILPKLKAGTFDGLITSPPYCNRYDYTRTYALELAMLGIDENRIRDLRQAMISCTVENRAKEDLGNRIEQTRLDKAVAAFESQELLSKVLKYLDQCKNEGTLNNNGIPRMVRNYFKELAIVIFECARLLKPGARFIMVNDNVKYQGVNIPVDLILSDIAQRAGFDIEVIWVLPVGKGNSSQQMKIHGREELRKCVYVWRRQNDTSQVTKSDNCSDTLRLAAYSNKPELS